MDDKLTSVSTVLTRTDERLRTGRHAADRIWPTGFGGLDPVIGGGLRSGGLCLLAGPQGLGKTTFALQLARNIVREGRPVVYFSYEHDPEDLIEKLVALEAGEIDDTNRARLTAVRAAFDAVGSGTIEDRLDTVAAGNEALARVRKYADLLHVHRSTGTSTDLAAIRTAVDTTHHLTGHSPMVVVDYLQKVLVPDGPAEEAERTTTVVEGLKDLAIDAAVPVLAVVAADKTGLESGRRMRVNHLRGSSALGYEADVVLILNSKYDIVARHHLTYDLGNAERFREWAVLSVEKNRFGRDGVELEFQKRFDQARFVPEGQAVREQLVDERVFTE
ncbi:DnaB-like helicase C-terminal domain-containing protein [Nocardioides sp. MAHUQ-72]|uniref:DnaB-like helicase C-terminal domain-containing protein n=1 Tax=unclassified Nocardioides TaxID=2615069 RepID=UPI003607B5C9